MPDQNDSIDTAPAPKAPVLADTVTLPIEEVIPYWRNPRKIPQRAIEAVAKSIRDYGYVQPIVVDASHVIIVGHTRLEAVRSLGWTEVPVMVASDLSEERANEYRLVDNRTSEMTDWDYDSLVAELREFEAGLLDDLFPELDLEVQQIESATALTQEDIDNAASAIGAVTPPPLLLTTAIVCPSCANTFKVRTDSLPGLSPDDLAELGRASV
jgi:ParB family transcriptional regulator, chromosome partitioning protein